MNEVAQIIARKIVSWLPFLLTLHFCISCSNLAAGADTPDESEKLVQEAEAAWHMGRYKDAEQIYHKVLKLREAFLGVGHASTIATVRKIADTYLAQERLTEAESMYQRALSLQIANSITGYEKALTRSNLSAYTLFSVGSRKQ